LKRKYDCGRHERSASVASDRVLRSITQKWSGLGADSRGSSGSEPFLHLIVTYQAGLLEHHAATRKHDEIWYATNIEARSKLRISLRIDFYHDRLASHVCGRARDFRSGSVTWPAPLRPEIHEHGHAGILDDFIEQRIVDGERFGNGRQGRLTFSARTGARKIFGWNAVLLAAVAAGRDDRHMSPSILTIGLDAGGSRKARRALVPPYRAQPIGPSWLC
jgi:hypothetical protein